MLCDGQPLQQAEHVAGDERDAHTFTDTDFYSQLLQEFLAGRATSGAAYAPAVTQVQLCTLFAACMRAYVQQAG